MTSKENQLAKEMVDLIKNIEEHTGQLGSSEIIPQLKLEIIVAKIKTLYEKSVILKYLHSQLGNAENITLTETILKPMAEDGTRPEVLVPPRQAEHITEAQSLHEKISSLKSSPTLAEKLQKRSIKKLSSSIALHEKLMFQKELFGGNIDEYNEAMLHLESLPGAEEAKKFLIEKFSEKNSWNKKQATFDALIAILEKRS